ncbi:MAG: ATP-binding protein [Phascolarctobacterium sp.]
MLKRKIYQTIKAYLQKPHNKVLVIDGARQVGKSFIIRQVGQELYPNFIEINLLQDFLQEGLFANTRTLEDFYLQVSMLAGNKMQQKENTLIFLDEIQAYPHLLTLLKFLQQDGKFTYIASGSLLGVALAQTTSIPMGSIEVKHMFPLDFEEFLWANGLNEFAISNLRSKFEQLTSLDENVHNKVLDLFKKYLLIGGLPDAVNTFLAESNIAKVRDIQSEIHNYYALDASKYDEEKKLKIRRIYEMIPSNLENKKKRVVFKNIENKRGKTYADYQDEFDYLINAGIALDVKAISTPTFPLIENSGKNLLKLYLNDVGILTNILYKNNIRAVLDNQKSINLGTVYESVVASELKAHGYNLYYYDNRNKGEVDFLIDDYDSLSTVPLEIKSGKDYSIHSALSNFVKNSDYHIQKAFVFSNERLVQQKGKITYLPIYYIMFFSNQ